ncbi:hypothetical protein WA026_010055 [Henosepilachna vigintioctopunctata]|uniref:J domain-containing protein n=1 Tax=Henosepilachna vigintioctopunctata TaxID=420089 RepID=A0AAW1U8U7_9CUCU
MNIILVFSILVIASSSCVQSQLLDGIYCGTKNCYDILNVNREASKHEIGKNYRKLAKQYHPDLHKGHDAKQKAEEQFKIIATAYEILKDDESRTDYDYMLDHPDEYYAHYYRYYRRRVTPKVDVKIVIFVVITIISAFQYYNGWQRYDEAIKYFLSVPKYRSRAVDIAIQDGLLDSDKRSKGKSKKSKEEIEKVIKGIIEDKMDIKGAYAKPIITDLLWIQLLICPYTILKYIWWYASWIWRHNLLNQPYSEEEKLYIIRKYMKIGKNQFDSQEDSKIQDYLDKELWIKENFDSWFKNEEENAKKLLAENNRHKQYRRYLKNHGVGRMTFDDS